MNAAYLEFPKEYCPNVSSPCWIPQVDWFLREQSFPQCDTFEKYGCMLKTARETSFKDVVAKCQKSCRAEVYKISTEEGEADEFPMVSGNFINQLFLDCISIFRKEKCGEFMLSHGIKASLKLCASRLKFITLMQ